jgi:hypothetical protein
MSEPQQPLRVSLEELKETAVTNAPETVVRGEAGEAGVKSYGNINVVPDAPTTLHQKGSLLLQAWFYLGVAGLVGSLTGWAVAEPGFVDGPGVNRWGNLLITPLVVTFMCVGFAVAESIVERSTKKVLIRGGLALPLGMTLGMLFSGLADVFYAVGLSICASAGLQSVHNPAAWIVRGIAWIVLGVAGGVVYGILGKSMQKTSYGALGGALGAMVGGTIFDPVFFLTHHGAMSRAIGFGLLGTATGVAIGLVESALKDRWLYVTAGPLAGKQFILYKAQTTVGSSQSCDIYLFKDSEILPQHASFELKGSKIQIVPAGVVYVGGQPVRGSRVLESGVLIQLGRYGFRYQERQRG